MQNTPVSYYELDTSLLPVRDQFAFWKEGISEGAGVECVRDGPAHAPFHLKMQKFHTDRLGLERQQILSPFRVNVSEKSRMYEGQDEVCIVYQPAGLTTEVAFGTDRRPSKPHDVRLVDMSLPFMASVSWTKSYAVQLNRTRLLSELPPGMELHGMFLERSPVVETFKELIPVVFAEMEGIPTVMADRLSERLSCLAIDAIRLQKIRCLDSAEISFQSKRAAICRYIERHYRDQDLSPRRIAEDLGMSRSTLYRVCEKFGAPHALIQDIRLKKAADILQSASEINIAKLAFDTGFSARQAFTRAFRREFGLSPRDFRMEADLSHQHTGADGPVSEIWSTYHSSLVPAVSS